MASDPERALTGSQGAASGRVGGTVLATIRDRHLGLTQEQLAEHCGVTPNTIQGWESGRRPLTKLTVVKASLLRRTLQRAGVSPALLAVLDNALRADVLLDELAEPDPAAHPFAHTVPDRSLTELLAWPMSGQPPRELNGHAMTLDVGAGVRDSIATNLREAVDRSAHDDNIGPMITRQALFLLASHGPSRDWVERTSHQQLAHTRDLAAWSMRWPMARTTAVAAAVGGDTEPLERFVAEGLSTDEGMAANLSYWAYWVGETRGDWSSDADMLTADDWSGRKLLASLCTGLDNAVPYRELCAHTLWALLRQRPALKTDPQLRKRIVEVVDKVTSQTGLVSAHAGRRLEQVSYAVDLPM